MVELRPITENDLDFMRRWRVDPLVNKWLEDDCREITLEQQKAWWEKRKKDSAEHWFGIWYYDQGPGGCGALIDKWRLVGWCQVIIDNALPGVGEVGAVVADPIDRKHGIGSDALKQLIHYCKDTLRLHKLVGDILPSNIASMRFLFAQGFKPDQYLENHCGRGDVIRVGLGLLQEEQK